MEHIEDKVNQLYPIFLLQPMAEFTEVLKREPAEAEKCRHTTLNSLLIMSYKAAEILCKSCKILQKARDHYHYTVL